MAVLEKLNYDPESNPITGDVFCNFPRNVASVAQVPVSIYRLRLGGQRIQCLLMTFGASITYVLVRS